MNVLCEMVRHLFEYFLIFVLDLTNCANDSTEYATHKTVGFSSTLGRNPQEWERLRLN